MIPYLLLTDDDVCDLLRLSARAVERLRRSGRLPCVDVEGHRRYRRQDVEAFVAGLGAADTEQQHPEWAPRLVGRHQKAGTA